MNLADILKFPDLTFDEPTHIYRYQGVVVPNVTRILDDLLCDFSMVSSAVLESARELGSAVHYGTYLDDAGVLDEATVDPVVAPYLEAWRKFRRELNPRLLVREVKGFHPVHRFATTIDSVMEVKLPNWSAESAAIGEIKTGALWPSYGPQTAAHAEVVQHTTGFKVPRRIAVQLKNDGNYKIHEFTDQRGDWAVFLSCLTIKNYRSKHA